MHVLISIGLKFLDVWSGTGMIMISLPILTTSDVNKDTENTNKHYNIAARVSDRTQYLTTARNLLISGADAIERLMSSYKVNINHNSLLISWHL